MIISWKPGLYLTYFFNEGEHKDNVIVGPKYSDFSTCSLCGKECSARLEIIEGNVDFNLCPSCVQRVQGRCEMAEKIFELDGYV